MYSKAKDYTTVCHSIAVESDERKQPAHAALCSQSRFND